MTLTPDQLAALEALEKLATPAPWTIDSHGSFCVFCDFSGVQVADMCASQADAAFIAALRNAAPALIAAIREQREELERMRAAIQFLFDDHELIGESEAHCTVQIQHETWRKLKAALNPNPQRDAKGA